MHISKLLLLSLVSFSSAAAAATTTTLNARDDAETQRNLADTDAKARSFTTALNNWTPCSAAGALAVNNAEQNLESSIDSTTSGLSDEINTGLTPISYARNTLVPDFCTMVDALNKRKACFAQAGLTTTYRNAVARLKSKSLALCDGLIRVARADQKSNAQAVRNRMEVCFSRVSTQS